MDFFSVLFVLAVICWLALAMMMLVAGVIWIARWVDLLLWRRWQRKVLAEEYGEEVVSGLKIKRMSIGRKRS